MQQLESCKKTVNANYLTNWSSCCKPNVLHVKSLCLNSIQLISNKSATKCFLEQWKTIQLSQQTKSVYANAHKKYKKITCNKPTAKKYK